jgi:phosphonate transport system substrate-binding protein
MGSPQKPIVIALEVYGDAERTASAGTQLADCLHRINGLTYTVKVLGSAAESVEALGSGRAQVAFLDPDAIVYGQWLHGFDTGLVILRSDQAGLAPFSMRQFIASTSSGIRSLPNIKGATFCFGEPRTFLGTRLPRLLLAAHGVNPDEDIESIEDGGFAEDIARAIYFGKCDAGATYVDVLTWAGTSLARDLPDLRDKVRVIHITHEIPNDGVQFARDLDPTIKQATSDALLAMAADNPGKHPPLVTLYKIEGFIRADNEFYSGFAKLIKEAGIEPASLLQ